MVTTTKFKTTMLQAIFVSSIIFGATSCDQNDHDRDNKVSDSIATKPVTADVAEDQNDGKFNESEDETPRRAKVWMESCGSLKSCLRNFIRQSSRG